MMLESSTWRDKDSEDSVTMRRHPCPKWKTIAACFAATSLCLLITLIVVLTNQNRDHREGDGGKGSGNWAQVCAKGMANGGTDSSSVGLFEDLSEVEILQVRDFMLQQAQLNLTRFEHASLNTNYIHLIQFQPPDKHEALMYLDSNGPKPEREALAVVFKGGYQTPEVEEYIVSPLPKPSRFKLRRIPGQRYPIPYNARPLDSVEIAAITNFIKSALEDADPLLRDSYDGYSLTNCADRCLLLFKVSDGTTSADRRSWTWFDRAMNPCHLFPLNFEVCLYHGGTDITKWGVEKIYYNNQTFDSVQELMRAYYNNTLRKLFVPALERNDTLFATYHRRGRPQPSQPMRGPEMFEPDGKRYTVSGRHIEYMLWSFDFRVESTAGIQIFDIEFNGERIIYELSLQEAIALYSGFSPMQSSANFLDSNYGMGRSNYELVSGIDCPNTATFFDLVHMSDAAKPLKFRNGVCVFELNSGIPLRRHFENNFMGGYTFYSGMVNHALVLRSISTVYNYDYLFDFVFYQNGAIEVRVSTSGYLFASFYTADAWPYGYPLRPFMTGTIHDHMMNFKVDLDVGGRTNSYEEIEIGIEKIKHRWIPNRRQVQKVMKRKHRKTELEAAYKFSFNTPTYLNFYSETETNMMGVNKGYRVQLGAITKQLYPDDCQMAPTISWSQYQMAVTRHKDSEQRSSSIYNQNGATNPQVDFRKFLADNESIIDEDLVAWVTVGLMHVPHTEDLPNTATVGNTAGFFIRPFNYFDEDPSIGSTNAVFITPTGKSSSDQKIQRYGTPTKPACIPPKVEIKYNGHYG